MITPAISDNTVSGSPTFKYSKKPIFTREDAPSMTMMLAIEPKMVKLPAKVEAFFLTTSACRGFSLSLQTRRYAFHFEALVFLKNFSENANVR
jgi:hypothetical protein